MPKKNITQLPENYPVCIHSDCTQASTCLHRTAYETLKERYDILTLINPERCTVDGACSYYRDSAPVRYARGFTGFQKQMYPEQYRLFTMLLQSHFGRNPYFERRKGIVMMPPSEQEVVMNALKQVGVTAELEFDSYEDSVNWCD